MEMQVMRKFTLMIDTSELQEEKTIIFYTENRILCKEKLRKCLNQMFEFFLKEDEKFLYFEFENEKDAFFLTLFKNFGYQLTAWFPEKYYYDAYFISSNYKLSLKYKLSTTQKNNLELKLNEETAEFPVVSLKTIWSSDEKYFTQYQDNLKFKKDFRKYVMALLILVALDFPMILWLVNDFYSRGFPVGVFLGVCTVIYAYRCLSNSIKQFSTLKKSKQSLLSFTKDGASIAWKN